MNSRAQIVATIGPCSGEQKLLEEMMKAGMDVGRINFSHGTHESNGGYMRAIRAAAQAVGKKVPVILDMAGPREHTEGGHAFDSASAQITEKDLADLDFCLGEGIEYVAQSYVGRAEDVVAMRAEIEKRNSKVPIIAKIERREAIEDFDRILAAADAIMIARGDLGLAIPIEDIPFVERDLIERTKAAGKPVIVATQMMLSMTEKRQPTRAEVTDVAYAIVSGADAVMLSEESALGKFPLEVVTIMERIVSRAEQALQEKTVHVL